MYKYVLSSEASNTHLFIIEFSIYIHMSTPSQLIKPCQPTSGALFKGGGGLLGSDH